jgi:hypothetical protein
MRRAKQAVIAVGCVFLLLAGCRQQMKVTEGLAVKAESKKAGPKITFENMICDFGKVGPGQKLNGEFKFANTGDAPLKVTKVERCCGVVTQLDKTEFAPGESGILYVRYTSSRMANKIMKRLYVNSNDKDMPRATLTVKAETVLKVTYEPKSIRILLKDLNVDFPPITIRSIDNKPFSITGFKATNNALTAEIDPTVKATQFVLEPKADMKRFHKGYAGLISISLAFTQADTPPETFNVSFAVLPRFTLSPLILICLYDEPVGPVTKTLLIANNYGEDFEIESTSSKEGHVKVLSQKKVGDRYRFELEITPPPGQDFKRFSDTFKINLKGSETLEVPCQGIYRAKTKKTGG